MTVPVPAAMRRHEVTWNIGHSTGDTSLQGARGRVEFEATAIAIAYSEATVLPSPVSTPVLDGVMTPVELLENTPGIWNWRVRPRLGVQWAPFHIDVDEPVDLASAATTPGTGPVRVVKGDRGAQGASLASLTQVDDETLRAVINDPLTGISDTEDFTMPRGPEGPYGGTEVTDAQMAALVSGDGTETLAAGDARWATRGEYAADPSDLDTDHTSGLVQAVESAVTGGIPLLVNSALHVTGNIPGFWNARPVGPGSITREGVTFHLSPRPTATDVPTNRLYVDGENGSNENDGLSPTYALRTLDVVYTSVLRRLTPEQAAGAAWVVRLSGGLRPGLRMTDLPEFPHGLVFEGDPLVDGSPVTTVDPGSGTRRIGLWFEPGRTSITVRNLSFRNLRDDDNSAGYGVLMKRGGRLIVEDCEADNCDTGFAAINNVDFSFFRCTARNGRRGFRSQYSSSGLWDNCKAEDNEKEGFYASRNAVAHLDFCEANGNRVGLMVDMAARVACIGNSFENNSTYGVRTEGAAEWLRDDTTPNQFHLGTSRENGLAPFAHFGASRENRQYAQNATVEHRLYGTYERLSVENTTAEQLLVITPSGQSVYADSFIGDTKKIRIVFWGDLQGSAGQRSLRVVLTNADASSMTTMRTFTISSGGSNRAFYGEVSVIPSSDDRVDFISAMHFSGYPPSISGGGHRFSGGSGVRVRLYAQTSNAGDSILLRGFELHYQG